MKICEEHILHSLYHRPIPSFARNFTGSEFTVTCTRESVQWCNKALHKLIFFNIWYFSTPDVIRWNLSLDWIYQLNWRVFSFPHSCLYVVVLLQCWLTLDVCPAVVQQNCRTFWISFVTVWLSAKPEGICAFTSFTHLLVHALFPFVLG